MTEPMLTEVSSSRLFRLAQHESQTAAPTPNGARTEEGERCDLCSVPIADDHRHLLNVSARRLVCACTACSTLFPGKSIGEQRYRLIPDRVRRVDDLGLGDVAWAELAIPVEMAFFFFDTAVGRIVALYPSALGVTESRLSLSAWATVAQQAPSIASLEPDVEALLVNRTRGTREEWVVPIDRCYRLAGLIRQQWRGLAGGEELWGHLDAFFDALRRECRDA